MANRVLVLSSGDQSLDELVTSILSRYGNRVTVGPEYSTLDDSTNLRAYDVVYLQANANWMTDDMPLAGQHALTDWVRCGGGLLTVEWTTWKVAGLQFTELQAVFPVEQTTGYGATATAVYTQVGSDPTVHYHLPATIEFPSDDYGGTEVDLLPRVGATLFYDSKYRAAGVVGWNADLGRVASVSSTAGPRALSSAEYGRMLANLVNWLRNASATDPADAR